MMTINGITGQIVDAAMKAQLLTHLKLSRLKVGLLINFNVEHLKEGIRRMVNKL
jgi:GxxExxY protein